MKKYFKRLFKYNDWANQRIYICIEENHITDEKIISHLSHMISVEHIWLLRIRGLPTSPFPVWKNYSISELDTMIMESKDNWEKYLEEHKMDTFEEMIFYTDSEGKKWENTINQIITHVINHSTHHRGEIVRLLRERGIEVPQTDYLFYMRIR